MNVVATTGPDDVWMAGYVGAQNTPAVFHFDGTTWTDQVFDDLAGSFATDVVIAGSDVFAAYGHIDNTKTLPFTSTIEKYDGQDWAPLDFPFTTYINSLSATSDHDIWATALTGDATGSTTAVYHYDGTNWRSADTATPIYKVSQQGTHVYFGGSTSDNDAQIQTVRGGGLKPVHLDDPGIDSEVDAIDVSDKANMVAVGGAGFGDASAFIEQGGC
jgi:hypothetical protein